MLARASRRFVLTHYGTAGCDDLRGQATVPARIDSIQAAAKDGHGGPVAGLLRAQREPLALPRRGLSGLLSNRCQRTTMRRGVYAIRQAANHNDTLSRQIPAQSEG